MTTGSGYVRLSQAADATNLSLEGMQRDVQRLADIHGIDMIHLRIDDGISGDVRTRPAFLEWLQDDVDVLLTYHTDRMTREGLNAAALILDRVEGKQFGRPVRLIDCDGLDSRQGDAFRFSFVIKAEIARSERQRMRSRARAMRDRAKATGVFAGGHPPFGWAVTDRRLTPEPAEQGVLHEISQRLLNGHTLGDVSRWLNAAGITTRRGKTWQRNTVRQLLFTDVSEHTWPPTVLLALREAVTIGPRAPRGRKPARLLSGLLACGNCDTRMVVNRDAYICPARGRGQDCPRSVSITCDAADAYVTGQFLDRWGGWEAFGDDRTVTNNPELDRAAKDKIDALNQLSKAPTQEVFDKLAAAQIVLDNPPTAKTTIQRVPRGWDVATEWANSTVEQRRGMLASAFGQMTVHDATVTPRIDLGTDRYR